MAYFYRYKEEELPGVDIFVCTADPKREPPWMVINTVLSAMSYNYPSNKLSVYLSDDGGSELTFYALLRASLFSKHWLPFCRRFKVQPTSPEAYFHSLSQTCGSSEDEATEYGQACLSIKVMQHLWLKIMVEQFVTLCVCVWIDITSNIIMARSWSIGPVCFGKSFMCFHFFFYF